MVMTSCRVHSFARGNSVPERRKLGAFNFDYRCFLGANAILAPLQRPEAGQGRVNLGERVFPSVTDRHLTRTPFLREDHLSRILSLAHPIPFLAQEIHPF